MESHFDIIPDTEQDWESIANIIREMKTKGVQYLHDFIRNQSEQWKDQVINIGLVGESGSGKSSFINKICGLKPGDEGFADVSTYGDTTTTCKLYTTPGNSNIRFWDLIGCGTRQTPLNSAYPKLVNLEKYDFMILMSDRCFSQSDVRLAEEVYKVGKPLFFVKTKLDLDFENARQDGNGRDVDRVLVKIRQKCENNIESSKIDKSNIFIISNRDHAIGDFDKLMAAIFIALPKKKKEALVYSLPLLSHHVIDEKKRELQKRMLWVSLISAGTAALPVPGVDILMDIGILTHEMEFILKEFGMTEDNLKTISNSFDLKFETLLNFIPRVSYLYSVGIRNMIIGMTREELTEKASRQIIKRYSKFIIPYIGSIVSSSIAYATCYFILIRKIDEIASDTHTLFDKVIRGRQV